MKLQGRSVNARLVHIERQLARLEHRFKTLIYLKDLQGKLADTAPLHTTIGRLVSEVELLHPTSAVGLAAKARIAVYYFNLENVGTGVLSSLAADLQMLSRRRTATTLVGKRR